MSGYLGGGGTGVQPTDLHQDWAEIRVSGADSLVSIAGSWVAFSGLTYTTLFKTNTYNYTPTASELQVPATGSWRIHMRPSMTYTGIFYYGLKIGAVNINFGAGPTSSLKVGSDTAIIQCTIGQSIVPVVYVATGTVSYLFTSALTLYMELLKPPI